MSYNLLWIFFLIIQTFAASLPIQSQFDSSVGGIGPEPAVHPRNKPGNEDSADFQNKKVISVRITSSVAVGRGRGKSTSLPANITPDAGIQEAPHKTSSTTQSTFVSTAEDNIQMTSTQVPPSLIGANIEYIKQLNAKKELKEHSTESVHPFQFTIKSQQTSDDEPFYEDSSAKLYDYDDEEKDVPLARKIPSTANANLFPEHNINKPLHNSDRNIPMEISIENESIKLSDSLDYSITVNPPKIDYDDGKNDGTTTALPIKEQQTERRDINKLTSDGTQLLNSNYQADDSIAESSIKSVGFAKTEESIGNIPQPGTVPLPGPSQNYIRGHRPLNEGRGSSRLTTVSFNIVHDTPKTTSNDNESSDPYTQGQAVASHQQFYDPPQIYSQPAKVYSEPAKFYSEPAKIYSEPAKIYSEPAKVYSEPAKIYSEPSKFYSEPASLHLHQNVPTRDPPSFSPWQQRSRRPGTGATVNTTPLTTATASPQFAMTQKEHQPEQNYEVDEKVSVLTDGRSHGVQETTTEKCKQDNCKVGYVVEGRQYKKYRVEERTPDGFLVGEYGVVRNEDGALRGVRYTADSAASPRLIQDALMKFLQLK